MPRKYRLLLPPIKLVLGFFFDPKYLQGRWFDKSLGGYAWAIGSIWHQRILRLSRPTPWPSHFSCTISNPANIEFHPDDLNNFQARGAYFQCINAKIYIGRGTYIAPNVGLITSNHNLNNLALHEQGSDIVLGEECWIGMNAVILPGVQLASRTIVAAGAVVTKSFYECGVVLAGVPAQKIAQRLPEGNVLNS